MEDTNVEQSWYTKYRPVTIEQYCGDRVKNIIKKRFTSRDKMPHVIMVYGKRGCGKTTLCRILTKYYMCENPAKDGTPCESCETCQDINDMLIKGQSEVDTSSLGIREVDATVANGKDDIQEIIEDAKQPPVIGEYKIIIFDECHMMTQQAQNSLLKIIEDIPPHLVIMFATTNPEKVLQTVKSRCQLTIEVRKQSISDMADRLEEIAKTEALTYSKEALNAIAKKGGCVPRECINILENVAKTYANTVNIDNVVDYLGDISSDYYIDYYKAANDSLNSVLNFINRLKENDVNPRDFVDGLLSFTFDAMYIKHGINLEDYPVSYVKTIKQLFDMYDSSDFDTLLQILEYMSNHVTAGDRSSASDLTIATTAMRIGKIKMLSNGLTSTKSDAEKENRISLVEHADKLKVDTKALLISQEQSSDDIDKEFEDPSLIENSVNMFSLPSYDDFQKLQDKNEDNKDAKSDDDSLDETQEDKDIDDFLS